MNLLCCVFHQICDGNEYIVQLRLLHGSSFSKDKLGGCQNSKANQHQRERDVDACNSCFLLTWDEPLSLAIQFSPA
jgi:hypothetical protein